MRFSGMRKAGAMVVLKISEGSPGPINGQYFCETKYLFPSVLVLVCAGPKRLMAKLGFDESN